MRNEDKERLNQQTKKKYLFHRLANGCKAVYKNTVHKIILIEDRQKFCVKVNKKHPFRQVLDI